MSKAQEESSWEKGRRQERGKERVADEKPSLPSSKTLTVTLLSSEWKSSKGGLSTISRELAIQLGKHLNVEVYVYLPKCTEEDKKVALSHSVQLIEAEERPGFEPIDWLISLPKGHLPHCLIGHGLHLGRQIPVIQGHHDCKWVQVVHTAPEELGMYKSYEEAIFKGEQKHQAEVKLCELADQVVAVGPKLADAYSRYLRSSSKDQDVINFTPSIFTEFLNVQQATEERRTFYVLVFGRGDGEDFKLKGYDIAVQAVAELKDASYQLMFVGAPAGKEDEVAEKLLQHGIPPSQLTVRHFMESREQLAKLFCEVDLAIMPSRTEGFGLTALEALSAGLPVLVSGNSGLGDALKKVPAGFSHVVDSEDPKEWAKAINIVRQKGREVRLEEANLLREKYALKYSWQKQCDCLVEKMLHLSFGNLQDKLEREQNQVENANEKVDNLEKPKETSQEAESTREKGEDMSTPVKKVSSMQAGLIKEIRQRYIRRDGWLAPFSWKQSHHFQLDRLFTTPKVVRRKKTRGILTTNIFNMSEIFNPHDECSQPRIVLIEGKPGMGKTTYCRKIAYDWATEKLWTTKTPCSTKKQQEEDCFPKFETVLLLSCYEMKSNLWKAIDDQLLLGQGEEEERKEFFNFICKNQSKVLLLLDGLDEVPRSKLSYFKDIIEGRCELSKCHMVATARHEAGIDLRIHCDTLLEIEGFQNEDGMKNISKYFDTTDDPVHNHAENLLSELRSDKNLKDMLTNPLHTALLCLHCEQNEGSLPESRSKLYLDTTRCILRRYRKKKDMPELKEDLIKVYDAQLKHLGRIALTGLRKDKLDFERSELMHKSLKSHADELPDFGFLSVQTRGHSGSSWRYSFQHKSFQEWFAAFFLSCQLIKKEIKPESLVADERYAHELKEVLPYTCGLLAARCKKDAVTLTKRMMAQVNQVKQDDKNGWLTVVLECTRECKQKEGKFQANLAGELGSILKLQTVDLNDVQLSAAIVAVLADVLKSNTTVTELSLNGSNIGDAGVLDLMKALKCNTTLTELRLSSNRIGEAGAAALAEELKSNKKLNELDLDDNGIGDAGAAALASSLESNTTLSLLHLSANGISNGATRLADYLKSNTTLSKLNLSDNTIGGAGAAGLADLLKSTTTLSALNLSRNDIGDASAAGLADALKSNATPRVLNLSENSIGAAGIADVADGLKSNTTLLELNLSCNRIGDDGAAKLADGLKFNTSLMVLDLSRNKISDAGAASLVDGLKSNTKLRVLHLSGNGIGDKGATCLAGALESNKTLTTLYLCDNGICNHGAAGLADALKSNTTMIKLSLSGNRIGDSGLAGLTSTLKSNKKLTLDLPVRGK